MHKRKLFQFKTQRERLIILKLIILLIIISKIPLY